jgi:hypothetical protein
VQRKKLARETADILKKACQLERDFVLNANGAVKDEWEKGINLPVGILGPFGFLLTLVRQAEEEHDSSEKESLDMDRDALAGKSSPESDRATANGASAENLGFHSLLNKDSKNKQPLFEESVNLSARVSCFVVETMMSQIIGNAVSAARFNRDSCGRQDTGTMNTLNRGHYVDWLHLLQHFICHPDECEKGWHLKAIDMNRSLDEYRKNATGYVLRWIDPKTQSERLKQVTRNTWEKDYHRYEKLAEAAWGRR